MALVNPFLEDDVPPFAGFPDDALRFLRELRHSNTREWFAANKARYEESVREPMESLLASLGERLERRWPDLLIDPRRSIYRIHRDVRFSKDKSPYKTHIAAAFTFRNCDRKTDPAFYFHIAPDETGFGGGLYAPTGEQLRHIRSAIDADSRPLKRILAQSSYTAFFSGLDGELLSRTPQGYDKDHPDAELLRRKQFLCWTAYPPEIALQNDFLTIVEQHVRAMEPLVRWLVSCVKG